MREKLPSQKHHNHASAADLRYQPFNDIIGEDTSPVFVSHPDHGRGATEIRAPAPVTGRGQSRRSAGENPLTKEDN